MDYSSPRMDYPSPRMEYSSDKSEKGDEVSSQPSTSDDDGSVAPIFPMPEKLAALSPEQLQKLAKWATFKMDVALMPMLVIMSVLNFLDRQNLASARLAGLEEDLNLNEVEYQTAVSILFVGYILTQVPSNLLVEKISYPAVYICLGFAVWGIIAGLIASVDTPAELIIARFFLGAVESVLFPGSIYLLSLFYNKKQLALRTAIVYSGSQLGNALGGVFAIGVLRLDGVFGLAGWRWLFVVEGILTAGLSIVFAFLLPNSNKNIMGMNPLENEWIRWNYVAGHSTSPVEDLEVSAWQGLMMACADIKTWMITGVLYCTCIVGAMVNFFPSVVGGLGYDRNTTYLLTAPPFLLAVFVMLLNGWHSDRQQERYLHVAGPLIFTLIANIIAVSTLSVPGRYVAMMLVPGSVYGSAAVTLSWITNTLNQPRAKRAAAIALINSICNTPNVWCAYLYGQAPRYLPAFIVNIAATGLAIVFATVTHIHLRRKNSKLDKGEYAGKHGPTPSQVDGGFRYVL